MSRVCSDCPKSICASNKSGRCKSCCARHTMATVKPWLKAIPSRQTPEFRAKVGRFWTEYHLGWCPEYLRDLYRATDKQGVTVAERRAMILEQYERDKARGVAA